MKLMTFFLQGFCLIFSITIFSRLGLAQPPAINALPLTVVDKKTDTGVSVSKEQVKLFLGNTAQTITEIVDAETPAKIVFLLDYSGSMRFIVSDPTKLKAAFTEFFKSANPANEYAFIAFNQDAALLKDWTKNTQEILVCFDSLTSQKPQGKTALFDSVIKSLHYLGKSTTGKRALIIITDGMEKNSLTKKQNVVDKSNELQIPLYSVVFNDTENGSSGLFSRSSTISETWKYIGKDTGGETLLVDKSKDLAKAFTSIGNLIRQQIIIKFTPVLENDNQRQNIKIKIVDAPNSTKESNNVKAFYAPHYVIPSP